MGNIDVSGRLKFGILGGGGGAPVAVDCSSLDLDEMRLRMFNFRLSGSEAILPIDDVAVIDVPVGIVRRILSGRSGDIQIGDSFDWWSSKSLDMSGVNGRSLTTSIISDVSISGVDLFMVATAIGLMPYIDHC